MFFCITFAAHFPTKNASSHAQMAELVDALVSNTNAARRAGSIPALGTKRDAERFESRSALFFFLIPLRKFSHKKYNLLI